MLASSYGNGRGGMNRILALVLAGASFAAVAQEQDIQRALIQRDQQSAEFAAGYAAPTHSAWSSCTKSSCATPASAIPSARSIPTRASRASSGATNASAWKMSACWFCRLPWSALRPPPRPSRARSLRRAGRAPWSIPYRSRLLTRRVEESASSRGSPRPGRGRSRVDAVAGDRFARAGSSIAASAATAMWRASTSKNARSAARVSLRPKPSVPRPRNFPARTAGSGRRPRARSRSPRSPGPRLPAGTVSTQLVALPPKRARALGLHAVAAQLGERGHAPDVGHDVPVLLQQLGRPRSLRAGSARFRAIGASLFHFS